MFIRSSKQSPQRGSVLAGYLVLMLIVVSAIAALASYVTSSVRIGNRRNQMIAALQYAHGAALVGAADLEKCFTNQTANLYTNLTAASYTLNRELSKSGTNVYQRTFSAPFSNQTAIAQLWFTNSTSPRAARIVGLATVGNVTQGSSLNMSMTFAYPAAIICDSPGSSAAGTTKTVAQDGNVCVNGDKNGPTVIDGGSGLAVMANGHANVDTNYATVPVSSISQTNFGSANQIPDYTSDGSTSQLFDFKRFIAVADASGNHFTNLATFFAANNAASLLPGGALEGVIVVDIHSSDKNIGDFTPTGAPKGINVRGTLVFNFGPEYGPTDKVINTATMNINAADLTGLKPSDPNTYKSGYPAVYTNPAKNPINIDISSKGFANFTAADDMPALMYNVGILDIHGNANICGIMYTPSFMEIENKADGQTQYFKGSLISGGGVYIENIHASTSIVSFDPAAIDNLATDLNKAKRVVATYWQ